MSITLSPPLARGEQEISKRHWTVEEFYRAYDAGELDTSKRWELIQGRITEKMIPGPPHAALADMIAQVLRDAMQPPFIVRKRSLSILRLIVSLCRMSLWRGARGRIISPSIQHRTR